MTKMIAIPSEGIMLNAHFGRSQAFTIYTINDSEVSNKIIIDTKGLEHQHSGIAQLLKSKGVETVICGGIGQGAIAGLVNYGLEVLRGVNGTVEEIAIAYAMGSLSTSEAVCNHNHGSCNDHGHQH